uniref:Uncharacterized protein n=1 Tax=Knipowitschia caucasica TaxID=637954 RepID=A0AAV2KU56_KNICA
MDKQPGPGASEGAGPSRKPRAAATGAATNGDGPDSPTGSHVEWCKQLIAATLSSQISSSGPADPRENRTGRRGDWLVFKRLPHRQDSLEEGLSYHGDSDSELLSDASASLCVPL